MQRLTTRESPIDRPTRSSTSPTSSRAASPSANTCTRSLRRRRQRPQGRDSSSELRRECPQDGRRGACAVHAIRALQGRPFSDGPLSLDCASWASRVLLDASCMHAQAQPQPQALRASPTLPGPSHSAMLRPRVKVGPCPTSTTSHFERPAVLRFPPAGGVQRGHPQAGSSLISVPRARGEILRDEPRLANADLASACRFASRAQVGRASVLDGSLLYRMLFASMNE